MLHAADETDRLGTVEFNGIVQRNDSGDEQNKTQFTGFNGQIARSQ